MPFAKSKSEGHAAFVTQLMPDVRRMTRNLLISVSRLATAQLASAQTSPYRFAVAFDGATSMEKIPDSMPGPIEEPDGTSIYITSCGFVRISYQALPLNEFLDDLEASGQSESFIWLMGEWCQSSPALLERNYRVQHLLGYTRPEDENILQFFLEIYEDESGDFYVSDSDILEFHELQYLARSIPHGRHDSGCIPRPATELEQNGRVPVGDFYCFESGVYLKDLANLEYVGP